MHKNINLRERIKNLYFRWCPYNESEILYVWLRGEKNDIGSYFFAFVKCNHHDLPD